MLVSLSEKPRLGQKVVVRRRRRRRNNLSRGVRWENRKRSRETSYGRVLYNYFRDYDASIGRYMQSDPIGLAAGLNTYSYVSNTPTMRSDKYGLYEGGGISEVMPGYDYDKYLDVIADMEYRPLGGRSTSDACQDGPSCLQRCLKSTYGPKFDLALKNSFFVPLTYAIDGVAELADDALSRRANRLKYEATKPISYSKQRSADRALRALRGFRFANGVVGGLSAFGTGYVIGAGAYCSFTCAVYE